MAGAELPLKYRFAPGHPLDGLTLTVPLALLNQVDAARLSWLVPGMIREKVTWYLKALPKALRNRLMPLPDTVTAFLEAVAVRPTARCRDALRAVARAARWARRSPADAWDGGRAAAAPRVQRPRRRRRGQGARARGAISRRCARSSARRRSCRSRRPGPALERAG